MKLQSLCVFCGSRFGARPAYVAAARALAEAAVRREIALVYGGASVGTMGALADRALELGGVVRGVIPEWLSSQEIAHRGLAELVVTKSMHERKQKMSDLADGYVAMPGGFGTLDELFEVLTWAQIGLHKKPIGLLDVDGFFQPLLQMVRHGEREGFIAPEHVALLVVDSDPASLLEKLSAHVPVDVGIKWTERRERT
jgi:hypothetical protein